MKMYGAGTTFQFNKKTNVYYDTLVHSPAKTIYIGLYTDKAVRAPIGKVNAVIVTEFADNVLLYRAEQGEITDERKQTILEAIEDGKKVWLQFAPDVRINTFLLSNFSRRNIKRLRMVEHDLLKCLI